MRRRWSLIVTVLISLFLVPQPARAWDWWDWAQEFSGPGPFHYGGNIMAEVCPRIVQKADGDGPRVDWQQPFSEAKKCYFLDIRSFVPDERDNFGATDLRVTFYESGPSMRVLDVLDIGYGVGLMHASSKNGGSNKFVLTFPRIVFKPIVFAGTDGYWRKHPTGKKWAGVVKYYLRGNIVTGELTGKDFGLTEADAQFNFRVSHDYVLSAGFLFDFTELMR